MLYKETKKIVSIILATAWLSLGLVLPASAQTVTQGYKSDVPVQRGMVVVIRSDDPTKIEPASITTIEKISGIVVNPNDSPLTISNDDQKNFVATVGRYEVLVNDQNGPIMTGDLLTISSLQGIAMKSDNTHKIVIGKALASFTGTDSFGATTIKDSSGVNKQVKIGRIAVDIGVTRNPNLKVQEANIPEILRKVSQDVAQKPVSAVRIYLGLSVLTITALIAGSMMFAGIRSSLISIGRNPLSKKSIYRGLAQIILASLIVFTSGIFGVYLLLRL